MGLVQQNGQRETRGSVREAQLRATGSASRPSSPSPPSPPPSASTSHWIKSESWSEWIQKGINGDEGAGIAVSLVLHIVLLAILAIPVVRSLRPGPVVSTLVRQDETEDVVIAAPIDTAMPDPVGDSGGGEPEMMQLTDLGDQKSLVLEAPVVDQVQVGGTTDGLSEGDDVGGVRMAQPKNAVRAGNFTVWTYPIRTVFGEKAEPGDFPRVGEDYYIVIQVKVPKERRVYRLSDLSGMVTGTDGYTQKIPAYAFTMGPNEELIRARTSRAIRVIDGVVQIFIRVPAANQAFVRDRIEIESRLLDEAQLIELVFEPKRLD